jgi:hypothetical protein
VGVARGKNAGATQFHARYPQLARRPEPIFAPLQSGHEVLWRGGHFAEQMTHVFWGEKTSGLMEADRCPSFHPGHSTRVQSAESDRHCRAVPWQGDSSSSATRTGEKIAQILDLNGDHAG